MIAGTAPVLISFDNTESCPCLRTDPACVLCGGEGFVDARLFVDREDVEPVKFLEDA